MKTRSTILSLATLATLSLSALAPTQALAWGHGGHGGFGHRFEGGYGGGHRFGGGYGRSWGYFGRSYSSNLCEGFGSRTYARAPMSQGFGPYGGRVSQRGFGRGPGMHSHGHRDSYEETPETESEAIEQQANPNDGPADYSSNELQK